MVSLQPLLELSIKEKHPSMEIRITDENENLISICINQYDFTKRKENKSNGGK
jgi:hypothetical protein